MRWILICFFLCYLHVCVFVIFVVWLKFVFTLHFFIVKRLYALKIAWKWNYVTENDMRQFHRNQLAEWDNEWKEKKTKKLMQSKIQQLMNNNNNAAEETEENVKKKCLVENGQFLETVCVGVSIVMLYIVMTRNGSNKNQWHALTHTPMYMSWLLHTPQ